METVYSEWVPAVGVRISLIILILVLAASLFPAKVRSEPKVRAGILLLLVLSGLALWNFWGIAIRVSEKEFLARYGILSHHISVEEIVKAEIDRVGFLRNWGTYTACGGDVVRIQVRGGRPFVVSSRRPEELRDTLNSLAGTSP